MKKILFILALTSLLSSCGIGTYSVISGNADEAAICFVADKKYDISVDIDGQNYYVETVKQKDYKNKRKIKKTVLNQISLTPGRHQIKVTREGGEIYSHEIFVSATDVKIIEL